MSIDAGESLHQHRIAELDYVYIRGELYQIRTDEYGDDPRLFPADEVPPEYFERWEKSDTA